MVNMTWFSDCLKSCSCLVPSSHLRMCEDTSDKSQRLQLEVKDAIDTTARVTQSSASFLEPQAFCYHKCQPDAVTFPLDQCRGHLLPREGFAFWLLIAFKVGKHSLARHFKISKSFCKLTETGRVSKERKTSKKKKKLSFSQSFHILCVGFFFFFLTLGSNQKYLVKISPLKVLLLLLAVCACFENLLTGQVEFSGEKRTRLLTQGDHGHLQDRDHNALDCRVW